MRRIIFVALVVAALALAEAVYHFIRYFGERKSDELKRRLRMSSEGGGPLPLLRRRRFADSVWLSEMLSSFASMERLESLLEQTDLELSVALLLFYMLLLASAGVVAGLVSRPVIAVPTSVGYGASFHGLAALLGMLNSCASNVTDRKSTRLNSSH